MKKLLIIDDDRSTRNLFRLRLADTYEIFDTGDPAEAAALALEHKPDAILMDLMMPNFSGFELCRSLQALNQTSSVPIFVVSGHAGAQFREQSKSLGASGYFEKPVNFEALKRALSAELGKSRSQTRTNSRIALHVPLKLRGVDVESKQFEQILETEQVSTDGFVCRCSRTLAPGASVEVFLQGATERYAGRARVLPKEPEHISDNRYAFQFEADPQHWVLQISATVPDSARLSFTKTSGAGN
jgi:DNA-binding response OmpR family regulator